MNTRQLVLHALTDVMTHPKHEIHIIRTYFAEHYHQVVNGEYLDFNHFINHLALLKQETKQISLTVLAAASEGNTVLTHHQVTAEKADGTYATFEVLAHFTVADGQIIRCEELTRMITGSQSDLDLGSQY
ncbi:nuclear transport factor 2 family protein [Vibrio ruber]|uniref:nuclear transport factor 2 family protein n=1 Tax=Vibrio ruber TaxID=184755 RepID=UPI002892B9D0|nr:nuclear transport factor 2 family protein [Vibrio ruber]WNJ98034.1 nuclear transport factor 2 family protein [Vibrio ruber]